MISRGSSRWTDITSIALRLLRTQTIDFWMPDWLRSRRIRSRPVVFNTAATIFLLTWNVPASLRMADVWRHGKSGYMGRMRTATRQHQNA